MIIDYNIEQLSYLIKNIFDLTGISISILDTDYNALTNHSHDFDFCSLLQESDIEHEKCRSCDEKLLKKCRESEKLESHICRAGLYDAAMPIIKNNNVLGYILMGRIRSEKSPQQLTYHHYNNINSDKLKTLYKKLPVLSKAQLVALYNIFPSILFDRVINIIYDEFTNNVIEYIDANLKENLSVTMLSEKFNVSVNYLYNAFHKNLNCTVNEYITAQRITRAKELLTETTNPIYSIAEEVGINNYTYFCKLFKKIHKLSPGEYRKTHFKHK